MYFFRDTRDPVAVAFTDRRDGVSGVPYDALNLAREGGDDPAAIAENWRLLLEDFAPGATLADMRQVHGSDVLVVDGPAAPDSTCDGLVTRTPDVVLAVRVADCVPVLLADERAGVIGAAHAGRLGVAAGVVPATVARMRDLGATDVHAWIGPHVCGGCYEVPAEMQEQVAAAVPQTRSTTTWGTPALDLGAGVRAQLEAEGVAVTDASRCTRETEGLYSHRRDGVRAGRQAGLVVVRP